MADVDSGEDDPEAGDDHDDDDDMEIDFQPSIPQPPSSQLTLSALDKTIIMCKNLILEYENDIENLQRGPTVNKMSKEGIVSEEKRKLRLIELETNKLSVYTEMQVEERKNRLEKLKKDKKEREEEREKLKYLEYNKRREEGENLEARDDSVSKGLLTCLLYTSPSPRD